MKWTFDYFATSRYVIRKGLDCVSHLTVAVTRPLSINKGNAFITILRLIFPFVVIHHHNAPTVYCFYAILPFAWPMRQAIFIYTCRKFEAEEQL